jgi:hypothetical protein
MKSPGTDARLQAPRGRLQDMGERQRSVSYRGGGDFCSRWTAGPGSARRRDNLGVTRKQSSALRQRYVTSAPWGSSACSKGGVSFHPEPGFASR